MKLKDLRPGYENVNLEVKILRLDNPKEITTSYDVTHIIVEGEVEDDSRKMNLTVWNENIKKFEKVDLGDIVELRNCFITSFKGVLSINVGRSSEVQSIEKDTF